jgi:hypothetical protein
LNEEIEVIFKDDLSSIQFMLDGKVIDPRHVLTALAAGALTVQYSSDFGTFNNGGIFPTKYVKSETWILVAKAGQ